MATSAGSTISYSDLSSWYTTFNNLCSKYSNGIATISTPASDSTVLATNINNLHAKITSFRSDKFLGTKSAWWPTGTNVTAGATIYASNLTAILGVVSNASKVKCKNTATNNNGKHSSTCPNGTNYNCTSSIDKLTGTNNRSMYNRGTCQSGTDNEGYHGNGSVIDITNAQSSKTN